MLKLKRTNAISHLVTKWLRAAKLVQEVGTNQAMNYTRNGNHESTADIPKMEHLHK